MAEEADRKEKHLDKTRMSRSPDDNGGATDEPAAEPATEPTAETNEVEAEAGPRLVKCPECGHEFPLPDDEPASTEEAAANPEDEAPAATEPE